MDNSIPLNPLLKQCSKCKQHKPATLEYFSHHRKYRDGLYYICKECNNASHRKPPKHIVPDGYKRCPQCGENKPATVEYFYPRKTTRDGLYGWCKPCTSKKHKDVKPRIDTEKTHQECIKCKQVYPATSEYFHKQRTGINGIRPTCKNCVKKASNKWRSAHREQAIANCRRWHITHKEHSNAYSRNYYATHREHYRERWPQYYSSHQEYIRQHQHKRKEERRVYVRQRRSRLQGASGTFTLQDIQKQYKNQHGKCYYCKNRVTKYHIDHIVPVIRGGSNDPSNLVVSCPTCNLRKGKKLLHEWPEGGRLL